MPRLRSLPGCSLGAGSDRMYQKCDWPPLPERFLFFRFHSSGYFGWDSVLPGWLSPAENQMRYVVLIAAASAVVGGCVALKEALSVAGERFYSTLGLAGMILAGPLYLVGEALLLAGFTAYVRTGQVPEVFVSLSELQDILLFFGGVLTYAATAAFAVSLGQVGWLGRGASRAYAVLSFVALLCLVTRGLQFPDPAASSMPWYTVPGFIAGIPAVPFIIPYLFGVISFRRTNREQARNKATIRERSHLMAQKHSPQRALSTSLRGQGSVGYRQTAAGLCQGGGANHRLGARCWLWNGRECSFLRPARPSDHRHRLSGTSHCRSKAKGSGPWPVSDVLGDRCAPFGRHLRSL